MTLAIDHDLGTTRLVATRYAFKPNIPVNLVTELSFQGKFSHLSLYRYRKTDYSKTICPDLSMPWHKKGHNYVKYILTTQICQIYFDYTDDDTRIANNIPKFSLKIAELKIW